MRFLFAGSNLKVLAAIVLGVGLTLFFVIQYIRSAEEDKITVEIQEETNEKREAIEKAIRKSAPIDNGDASDSLRYLRDRQSNQR